MVKKLSYILAFTLVIGLQVVAFSKAEEITIDIPTDETPTEEIIPPTETIPEETIPPVEEIYDPAYDPTLEYVSSTGMYQSIPIIPEPTIQDVLNKNQDLTKQIDHLTDLVNNLTKICAN